MNIVSRKTIDDFHNVYIETELDTEKYGKIFVNVTEEDYNDKTPFEETEAWVYTKSYEDDNAKDNISNYAVALSDDEFKTIYDFVINN